MGRPWPGPARDGRRVSSLCRRDGPECWVRPRRRLHRRPRGGTHPSLPTHCAAGLAPPAYAEATLPVLARAYTACHATGTVCPCPAVHGRACPPLVFLFLRVPPSPSTPESLSFATARCPRHCVGTCGRHRRFRSPAHPPVCFAAPPPSPRPVLLRDGRRRPAEPLAQEAGPLAPLVPLGNPNSWPSRTPAPESAASSLRRLICLDLSQPLQPPPSARHPCRRSAPQQSSATRKVPSVVASVELLPGRGTHSHGVVSSMTCAGLRPKRERAREAESNWTVARPHAGRGGGRNHQKRQFSACAKEGKVSPRASQKFPPRPRVAPRPPAVPTPPAGEGIVARRPRPAARGAPARLRDPTCTCPSRRATGRFMVGGAGMIQRAWPWLLAPGWLATAPSPPPPAGGASWGGPHQGRAAAGRPPWRTPRLTRWLVGRQAEAGVPHGGQ